MKEPYRNLLNFISGWIELLEGVITILSLGFYRPGLPYHFSFYRLNKSMKLHQKERKKNEGENYSKKKK